MTTSQLEPLAPPTAPLPAAPMPRNLDDLHELLQMYNDVTQRLQVSHDRLQQEIVRLREQLEEKNRELEHKKRLAALGEMAAGIAHEIRNPLGGIQLYASTLALEVADRSAAAELVRKIASGVKDLNLLVSDMLTFTRDLHLAARRVALSDIVASAIELAAPTLQESRITVTLDPSSSISNLHADPRLLQRVLLNLLLNAAEAIRGAEHAAGEITLRARRSADHLELIIEDDGPGIPAELLERIFDPFFTTKHTGTGLGLAIVHRIIEAHGGRITAENRAPPHRGARFRLVFSASHPTLRSSQDGHDSHRR